MEKTLYNETKQTRHDLGREAFLAKVWEWKESKGGRIMEQVRRVGSSVDWDHENFTMDPHYVKAVKHTFKRMMDEGLVQASLSHPNVLSVTDIVEIDGAFALVLDWVEGPTLKEWMASGPPLEDSLDVFRDIVRGVRHIHAAGHHCNSGCRQGGDMGRSVDAARQTGHHNKAGFSKPLG